MGRNGLNTFVLMSVLAETAEAATNPPRSVPEVTTIMVNDERIARRNSRIFMRSVVDARRHRQLDGKR